MMEYRLPMDFTEQVRSARRAARLLAVGLMLLVGAIAALALPFDLPYLLFLSAVAVAAGLLGASSLLTRQRASWAAYSILLAEDSITQRHFGAPDVCIRRGDVERIEEDALGRLIVRSFGTEARIVVSEAVEGYDQLRCRLNEWKPIEPGSALEWPKRSSRAWLVASLPVVLAATVALLRCDDAVRLLLAEVGAVVGAALCLAGLIASPSIGRPVKILSLLMVVPGLALVARALRTALQLLSLT